MNCWYLTLWYSLCIPNMFLISCRKMYRLYSNHNTSNIFTYLQVIPALFCQKTGQLFRLRLREFRILDGAADGDLRLPLRLLLAPQEYFWNNVLCLLYSKDLWHTFVDVCSMKDGPFWVLRTVSWIMAQMDQSVNCVSSASCGTWILASGAGKLLFSSEWSQKVCMKAIEGWNWIDWIRHFHHSWKRWPGLIRTQFNHLMFSLATIRTWEYPEDDGSPPAPFHVRVQLPASYAVAFASKEVNLWKSKFKHVQSLRNLVRFKDTLVTCSDLQWLDSRCRSCNFSFSFASLRCFCRSKRRVTSTRSSSSVSFFWIQTVRFDLLFNM